ncbi:MAG: nucleotidyltransferase family protein [Anaerolineales bacterium]|nr:nucleotidyltransferase family protein [Anaerolineales bacterium]
MTGKIPRRNGAFPTLKQELFLQAALLPGGLGLAAWRQWKQDVAWEEDIDAGSFALLSLLYVHLKELGVEDPAMGRFKGIYRKVWYQNQTLVHETADVLRLFETGRMETMVLKGAALAQLYYKDFGLRKMHDLDVVIPAAGRRRAIDMLTRAGWKPRFQPISRLTDSNLDCHHAWAFENGRGFQLDLHWNVLTGRLRPGTEEDLWAASVPLRLEGVSTRTLCPADQLLHACVHGVRWSPMPPIRWVADSFHILKAAPTGIDWDRLIGLAEECRTILAVREAFLYLRESFHAEIPDWVLRRLNGLSVTPGECRYYESAVAPQSPLLGELPVYWNWYLLTREWEGKPDGIRAGPGFLSYLRRLKMMTRRQFLSWMLSRVFIRVRGTVKG